MSYLDWQPPRKLWDTEAVHNQSVVHEVPEGGRLDGHFVEAMLIFLEKTKGVQARYCLMHPAMAIRLASLPMPQYVPPWEKGKATYLGVTIIPTATVHNGVFVMRCNVELRR